MEDSLRHEPSVCRLERMRENACALKANIHKRVISCRERVGEEFYIVTLQVRVLRFERVPGRFERPDFRRPTYVFVDRKNVRKYFFGNPLLVVCMKI